MTLATTAELVARAVADASAVAALNVITLEHAEGIVAGAEQAGTPVIMQISENAVRYHGGALRPLAAACRAIAEVSTVGLALHLDHVTRPALLAQAAGCGLSSVMFDAGDRPYTENLAATRDAVRRAHADGLWIEAELGYVGGKPGAPSSAHTAGVRTDPGEARAFVADTGVDALAVAVGSSHAMTERTAGIDDELVEAIAAAAPVPLVLHGSSGVRDADLRRGVHAGLRKINVGTALNVALTRAVREHLAGDATAVDPRHYLRAGRDAVAAATVEVLRVVTGADTMR